MKYYIDVKTDNGRKIKVGINRPELIYGATALITNKRVDEYGVNPATNEKLAFIVRKGSPTRFFVPAHIQKDNNYARKHNLEIRQCVAPYFLGKKEETPNPDYKTEKRHSVVAIIRNTESDTYLCEDAKGRSCKSFIMGGIEDGEAPEKAAIREVVEETGYCDVK